MGISIWGTPLFLLSNMKIGVSNTLGLEPSVDFHQFKIKDSYEKFDYDTYKYITAEQEYRYNLLYLSNIFDIKAIRKERSNFVIRLGVGYWRAKLMKKLQIPIVKMKNLKIPSGI